MASGSATWVPPGPREDADDLWDSSPFKIHQLLRMCFQHHLLQEALSYCSIHRRIFQPLNPWSQLHPSWAQKLAGHTQLSLFLLQQGLEVMTCDLLSILPSAPPRPGTQQVLGNWPGSCSCKKPTSLSKPGQREQSWLRAICFIIPSTRLAPPV